MGDRRIERLFRRFRSRGDAEALGEVFDAVAPELGRIARHLVGDAVEAEDLVQSTFLTALEKAADYDAERRLVPWLVGILARHAANARRRTSRDRAADATPPDGMSTVEGKLPDAARAAEAQETRVQLEQAVDALAPTYREVIAPHLFEGKALSALALELGISAGAVRVRLHRGLKLLRAALPAGIVAAGAGSAGAVPLSAAALAPARAEVLAAARALVPQLVSSAPAALSLSTLPLSTWFGGLLVSQRILFSAVLTIALLTTITLMRPESEPAETVAPAHDESAQLLTVPADEPRSEPGLAGEAMLTAQVESREQRPSTDGILFQGRVLHRFTEEPIAGASLFTTPAGAKVPALKATCDEQGRFEFRAPACEENTLRVDAEGFAPWMQPLSADRRERYRNLFGRRELEGGECVDLGAIILCPGVSFQGRALWAHDRSPVGGAELLVFLGGERLGTIEERVVGRSQADGTLEFDHLLPVFGSAPYVIVALHEQGIGWTHVPPAAGRQAIGDLEVLLAPPFELEVTVQDANREVVPGAVVHCTPRVPPFPAGGMKRESDHFFPAPPALASRLEAETDERGVARFHSLPPVSSSTITPSAISFSASLDVLVEGEVRARDQVRNLRGSGGSTLVILPSDEGDWITGRVLGENGSPLSGIAVRLNPMGRTGETDEQGQFRLARRPADPDVVELRASAEGLVSARLQLNFWKGSTPLDGHELVLLPPLTIEGHLEDDSGQPIVGTRIWAYEGNGDGRIAGAGDQEPTDENGHFVIDDATAGEWRLWPVLGSPELGQRYKFSQDGFLAQGGDRAVRIVLERRAPATGALEVAVIDADSGDPVDPVRAQLFPREEAGMLPMPELGAGQVAFENLVPGTYDLWLATANRRMAHATFEVEGATPRTFGRVEVGGAGALVGQVDLSSTDLSDGRLPERSFVMGQKITASGMIPGGGAFEGATSPWVRAEVDEQGKFSAKDLMPGLWSFELHALGLISLLEAEVQPGEQLEITLELKRAAVLELIPERSPGTGWMVVELQSEGGQWQQKQVAHESAEGPPSPCSMTLEPGLVRWRASFKSGFGPLDDALAAPQEGETELAPGDHQRVEVRVE